MKKGKGNVGGRPRTGSKALPAVRIPKELHFRLERRLALISAKGGTKNLSLLVRQSLEDRLDLLDQLDREGH
jgi:hypothetical protein